MERPLIVGGRAYLPVEKSIGGLLGRIVSYFAHEETKDGDRVVWSKPMSEIAAEQAEKISAWSLGDICVRYFYESGAPDTPCASCGKIILPVKKFRPNEFYVQKRFDTYCSAEDCLSAAREEK